MAIAGLHYAEANPASGANTTLTPSDFIGMAHGETPEGPQAFIVRSIAHEGAVTLNRIGDPDADGTFEINQTIESRNEAGERSRESWILTDDLGIEIVNDAASTSRVIAFAERIDIRKVWVEFSDNLANNGNLDRVMDVDGQDQGRSEYITELVLGGEADIKRRIELNDDNSFDDTFTVESGLAAGVYPQEWLPMFHRGDWDYPKMAARITNVSGGSADFIMAGTVGEVTR